MSTQRLSPAVLAAREKLAAGREKLRKQHRSGSPGIQVSSALTELLEGVVLDLYRATFAELGVVESDVAEQLTLVAYGGFGRRDIAPYSDVDLMLLHAKGAEKIVAPIMSRFTQQVFDVGLQLGSSVRTPEEACALAQSDATIFTSLAESRLFFGSDELYQRFLRQFRRVTRRRGRRLLTMIDEARRDERKQYGETNYMLEPHIKRSRGGLRDLQLIRWVGFVRCGEVEPESFMRAGLLAREEWSRLQAAREYLLRLRNELHFHAEKANDVLTKSEQLRLAALYGYPGAEGVLPVEQFMRDYFKHTSEVRYIASNFLADSRPQPMAVGLLAPIFAYKLDRDFRVGPRHISVAKQSLAQVSSDPAEILRLMELASLTDRRIEHRTWHAIREAMLNQGPIEVSAEVARRFLSLLGQPARLGELLRRLHELRVLERLIRPMTHARHLLQFNDFHKYTVDEHSIRTVECATEFRNQQSVLGNAYSTLRRKDLLHLALLIHDLGKGYPDDHSEVGRRLAESVCADLGMSDEDTDTVRFLVHKHLLMSQLAQWRDTSDNAVVVKFAVEVATPDRLQMLYVLTCADLAGVGPGVLTDWKLRLLTELYQRTLRHIAGDPQDTTGADRIEGLRQDVRSLIKPLAEADWWNRHLGLLPRSYLLSRPAPQIARELERLRTLPRDDAIAWSEYDASQKTIEFTIGTYEDIAEGIFHRLTGALTSKGLQILSAEINTLGDGLVLDRFVVEDRDYRDEPPPERLAEICRTLIAALKDTSDRPPPFRKVWGAKNERSAAEMAQTPTVVKVDNYTSEKYTIIDVFTFDRMGLLYTITRTLFDLGLSVGVAKIGTHLDQVVDVFYVTNREGRKVRDEDQVKLIRNRLHEAIEEMASGSRPSASRR